MLDFEAKESYLYFTTECIDGETLSSMLAGGKKLSLEATLEIGIGIARGLAHAHDRSRNVVHQDINPDNVYFRDRRVILRGFGVAAILSEVQDRLSGLVGKTEYLSPEQVTQQSVDFRSDIYSFGVILYEALTGTPPFTGDNPEEIALAIENDAPAAITNFTPEVPAEVEDFIYQCLEKEKDQRPQNCEEIASKLEDLLLRCKILQLKNSPHVYTSPSIYYPIQLLDNPIFAWLFFPGLSILLLAILAAMMAR